MNGWFTFSKICLFALNFIFLIIGLLMIAIGIWNIVESASFFEAIAFFGKTPTTVPALFADTEAMRIFAWILVIVGGLAFVISFLACWGVASENKWILITYAAVVSFLVLVEVLFVILLFGLEHQWGPKLTQEITDTFSTNYVGSMGAFEPTKYDPFSLAMDAYMLKQTSTEIAVLEEVDPRGESKWAEKRKSVVWVININRFCCFLKTTPLSFCLPLNCTVYP
ncbi:unnamed protein product [Dicrocoelium dendriticum]|nr:unnamed protein product [Dicrocoelium dendriticum]